MNNRGVRPRTRRLLTAVGLFTAGTTVVIASAATASAAPAGTPAGHTIAAAQQLTIGQGQSGGGGAIDFWLVKLVGGDQVQLSVQSQDFNYYNFALYAPGTTDGNFANAPTLSEGTTNYNSGSNVLTVQAPYTGDFVFAVCENSSNYNCSNVDSGSGNNPMQPYTFTPTLIKGGVSAKKAAGEVKASATIAKAPELKLGNFEAGGGNAADFWRMSLVGGDRVQLAVASPDFNYFNFALYTPGTNDTSFPQAPALSESTTNYNSGSNVLTVQAPYTGNFLFVVCENSSNYNCGNVDSGSGNNPMQPYTFTPTLIAGGITGKKATDEVKASPRIAKAPALKLGNFEAGGGNAADFWRLSLVGGDKVQIAVASPEFNYFNFALYASGTNDTNFPQATAVSEATTNYNSGTNILTVQAPRSGNFVFVVCENASNYNCGNVDSGSGNNPMQPYTFTPTLVGKPGTKATLKLSKSSLTDGSEKSLKFSVTVTGRYGTPTGTVTIKAGKKTICTAKLSKGFGKCSPSSNTELGAGTYSIVASYGGNGTYAASKSKSSKLKIAKR